MRHDPILVWALILLASQLLELLASLHVRLQDIRLLGIEYGKALLRSRRNHALFPVEQTSLLWALQCPNAD
jgi:hypothetical protein